MSTSDVSAPGAPLAPSEFTAVIDRHQGALYRFLRELISNPEQARDLVQDIVHDAWRVARRTETPFLQGSSPEAMRAWLFQAAYHRAISALRRQRLIRWESLEGSHGREPEAFSAINTFEDDLAEREALRAALERPASQDVACLLLRHVHGFSPTQIGTMIGSSPAQVSKRLARARQRLRSVYLAQESSPGHVPSKKESRR